MPIAWDKQYKILKGLVGANDYDNTPETNAMNTQKTRYLKTLYRREKATSVNAPASHETLFTVLPSTSSEGIEKTSAKAVEQILRTGVAKAGNQGWPPAGTYDPMFTIKTNVNLQDT